MTSSSTKMKELDLSPSSESSESGIDDSVMDSVLHISQLSVKLEPSVHSSKSTLNPPGDSPSTSTVSQSSHLSRSTSSIPFNPPSLIMQHTNQTSLPTEHVLCLWNRRSSISLPPSPVTGRSHRSSLPSLGCHLNLPNNLFYPASLRVPSPTRPGPSSAPTSPGNSRQISPMTTPLLRRCPRRTPSPRPPLPLPSSAELAIAPQPTRRKPNKSDKSRMRSR